MDKNKAQYVLSTHAIKAILTILVVNGVYNACYPDVSKSPTCPKFNPWIFEYFFDETKYRGVILRHWQRSRD